MTEFTTIDCRQPDYTEKQRNRVKQWKHDKVAITQDVATKFGTILERGPQDIVRREKAEASFLVFCETYFRDAFTLAWSRNHLVAADKIEAAARHGESFAFSMPRGSGKTTLCRAAVMWAIACGLSPYVVFISATMRAAERQLKNIKTILRANELLFQDFPELCAPVRHLDNVPARAASQKFCGEPTMIEWLKNQIVLAALDVPYARCSGAIIDVTGIEGEIRGRQLVRGDGSVVRPTLAVVDDPQSRESARSAAQSEQREEILSADIKFMAPPDRGLGIVIPCTVICKGDMADRLLDRKLHPEYQGMKTRAMDAFPTNQVLWKKYADLRDQSFQEGGQGKSATELYRANRTAMDAGAIATWPERFHADRGEISAIQHCMNAKFSDEAAFAAEYQNEPLSPQDSPDLLTPDQIAAKLSGLAREIIPTEASLLTAFVDVQGSLLYWLVTAWSQDFSGAVVDYGTWPEQRRNYFTLLTANPTLQTKYPQSDGDGAILAAIEDLAAELCGREWKREDGAVMRLNTMLVDESYKSSLVHRACRRSRFASTLKPSKGYGDIAKYRIPFMQVAKKPGDRISRELPWRERFVANNKSLRFVMYDTNFFKGFVHDRLAVGKGSSGSLELFGSDAKTHRLLADHLVAESKATIKNSSTGRTVDEWTLKAGRPDNHWFDCLVGCAVAAAMLGASPSVLPQAQAVIKRPARKKRGGGVFYG